MKIKGFFNIDDIPGVRKNVPPKVSSKIVGDHFKPGSPNCKACGLKEKCKSGVMPPGGLGKKDLLMLAEAPGPTEDELNDQLLGEAGQFFENKLWEWGRIKLHEDCHKLNAINCYPTEEGKMRAPTKKEIHFCRPYVIQTIYELKPRIVVACGGKAIESLYMDRFKQVNIGRWMGRVIPDYMLGALVIPIYHPSAVLRDIKKHDKGWKGTQSYENMEAEFRRQIELIAIHINDKIPMPQPDYSNQVVCLYKYEEIEHTLDQILLKKPRIFVDFETTGLKPFQKGHRLETCSIDDGETSYSFPVMRGGFWTSEQLEGITSRMIQIFEDPDIGMDSHNLKFEDLWMRKSLGARPLGWIRCTMTDQHILDGRKYETQLKYQAFVRFGVVPYDQSISPFLKTSRSEEFNKIHLAMLEDLLLYGGMDTVMGRMLRIAQDAEFKVRDRNRVEAHPPLSRTREFFRDGLLTFSNMQIRGIPADEKFYRAEEAQLEKRITRLERVLTSGTEAGAFREFTGRDIKLTSNKDLQDLLFKVKGLPVTKKTTKGAPSVDVEVLTGLKDDWADRLIKMKKLKKVKDTYLAQFFREIVDEKIHPFFDLHTARTYRSSSSKPNFHNIPVRDEEAKRVCRTGICPSPERRLSESDYGGIEVCIAACYTQDPELVHYIETPGSDMHRDQGEDIYILDEQDVTKKLRFYAKNGFVFPEFYGSYYAACAQNIWYSTKELSTGSGQPIRKHLADQGIHNLEDFIAHMKKVEDRFWDRFRRFREWQREVLDKYKYDGYISMLHGFQRTGYLSRNEVINTPIQGTAFHCLLWSLNRMDQIQLESGWDSELIVQIHDCMIEDLVPSEQDEVITTMIDVATEQIKDEHPWLIVPLTLEIEFCPINSSWYKKEEVERKDGQWIDKYGQVYDLNY